MGSALCIGADHKWHVMSQKGMQGPDSIFDQIGQKRGIKSRQEGERPISVHMIVLACEGSCMNPQAINLSDVLFGHVIGGFRRGAGDKIASGRMKNQHWHVEALVELL